MISYEHDVPHLEVRVQPSSSICDNQDLHPQEKKHPDGKGDLQEPKAYVQWISQLADSYCYYICNSTICGCKEESIYGDKTTFFNFKHSSNLNRMLTLFKQIKHNLAMNTIKIQDHISYSCTKVK